MSTLLEFSLDTETPPPSSSSRDTSILPPPCPGAQVPETIPATSSWIRPRTSLALSEDVAAARWALVNAEAHESYAYQQLVSLGAAELEPWRDARAAVSRAMTALEIAVVLTLRSPGGGL